MTGKPDFYAALGVKRDAPAEEIRRSYRRLALKYHPDRNPGNRQAEERFKTISDAYGVLADVDKRKKYDQERSTLPPPAPNYPVADVSVEVELEGRDHINGVEKTVTVTRPRTCPDCRGYGKHSSLCMLCQGAGCQACTYSGYKSCAKCWGTGKDKEVTQLRVVVPPDTPPYGRIKLVALGSLWGVQGPFYVYANITVRVHKPGLIIR